MAFNRSQSKGIHQKTAAWFQPGKKPKAEPAKWELKMASAIEDQQITHVKPKYRVTVTEAPKFDLPSYIANYKGRTVFRRLYLIASCSTVLGEEAARLAIAEARKGSDIHQYRDAVEKLAEITGRGELTDKAWLSNQEKQNAAESKRLENELKQYKNNLIRESIRVSSGETTLLSVTDSF